MFKLDELRELSGVLEDISAAYAPGRETVRIHLELLHHRCVCLYADRTQTCAAITELASAISQLDRIHHQGLGYSAANGSGTSEVWCAEWPRKNGIVEGLRFKLFPSRNMLRLAAGFTDNEARTYQVRADLTRTEAGALLHDLKRGRDDLENSGGVA